MCVHAWVMCVCVCVCVTHLRPVIANGVCKHIAIVIETTTCDGELHCIRGLQLCTGIFVPETKLAV